MQMQDRNQVFRIHSSQENAFYFYSSTGMCHLTGHKYFGKCHLELMSCLAHTHFSSTVSILHKAPYLTKCNRQDPYGFTDLLGSDEQTAVPWAARQPNRPPEPLSIQRKCVFAPQQTRLTVAQFEKHSHIYTCIVVGIAESTLDSSEHGSCLLIHRFEHSP